MSVHLGSLSSFRTQARLPRKRLCAIGGAGRGGGAAAEPGNVCALVKQHNRPRSPHRDVQLAQRVGRGLGGRAAHSLVARGALGEGDDVADRGGAARPRH